MELEISDDEIITLVGQKEIELWIKNKLIEGYKAQLEKAKDMCLELESIKKSNKSLSDTNMELDRALTEARKERDVAKSEVEMLKLELNNIKECKTGGLDAEHNKSKKRSKE